MKLSEYPRPPADNGRGIHWSPSQYQWGRKDWLKWQKRILEMGLKWVKLNVPPDYNAEAVTKRLIDIEVMPVCRFISKNPTRLGGAVEKTIDRLIKIGVRYFETNNEPDADVEWKGFRRPSHWEEIVIKNLIHDAHRIQALGGFPAFVAFNVGPTESRNPIQILLQQPDGREALEKGMWISLHNYGKGRPFNYPNDRVRMFGDPITKAEWLKQGQPDFWTKEDVVAFSWHKMTRKQVNQLRQEQKNPAITILEDITCFRAFEYWNHLVTQEGLESIPIMMTEGGWETGDRLDPIYPEPTAQRASELNFKMFQFIQGDAEMVINKPDGSTESYPVPDYFFAVMPWHMGEKEFGRDTSGQWEQGAWFTHWYDLKFGLNGELPIIQMLRDLPSKVRADGPVPPGWNQRRGLVPKIKKWDHRLIYLGQGVQVQPVEADGPKWKVVSGLWQDKDEINPEHALPPGYIMVKVLAQNGDPIPDAKVAISRKEAAGKTVTDTIFTKGPLDDFLGNYRMTATLGTYTVKVVHKNYPSEAVVNVGLGGEYPNSNFDPTSFLFTFQLTGAASTPPPTDAETPLPAEGSPTPPPSDAINDAVHLGVQISPVGTQSFCTVDKVHHVTPADNLAPNMLYLDVIDQQDQRVFNAVIMVKNDRGQTLQIKIEKPAAEPGGNMPMWPDNKYSIVGVKIAGENIPSETVTGLQAAIAHHGDGHSFLVVYRLH